MAGKCLTRMVKKHKSPIETTVEMSAEYVSDTGKISHRKRAPMLLLS
jgi:hypothetical protein